jgi:probable phosphoglycerate mutase
MGSEADRTPGRLILVKHGQPLIEPARPRSQWELSDAGREAAMRLAGVLARFEPCALFASPERKAADTAAAIGAVLGLPVEVDAGFGEHRADEKPFGTEAAFLAEVAALFAQPEALVMGEETGAAARARFDTALRRTEGEGTRIVVAHGRVIALWLSGKLGIDPWPFWRALGVGEAVVVGAAGYEMVRA